MTNDLPNFAGTRAFVRKAGPIYAFLILACFFALIGAVMYEYAMILSAPASEALLSLGSFGAICGLLGFGAGVLWSGLIDEAKEHHELLSSSGDGGPR